MSLTGDFAKLRTLTGDLDRFSFRDVTEAVGGEVLAQYQADFAAQRDPWGSSWSSGKGGHVPVLYRSGRLANPQLIMGANKVGLRPESYWVFHQTGANGAPTKAVVPFGDIEGTVWGPPLIEVVKDAMEEQLGERP